MFQIALKCVYNWDTEDDTPLQKAVSETNASLPDEFGEEEYFKNFIKVLDKL